MIKDRILIVDDEEDLREILSYNLQTAGYDTVEASSAEEALRILQKTQPPAPNIANRGDNSAGDRDNIDNSRGLSEESHGDGGGNYAESANSGRISLIILDVMMAGMNGFDMARVLRQEWHSNVPVIFLTAKDRESDMLKGFARGGDDYITKPFSLQEVLARVKAVLRRTAAGAPPQHKEEAPPQDGVLRFGGLVINNNRKMVTVDEEEIHLSPKEFGILYTLATHRGRVFSREDILDAVWKGEAYVLLRTIDVHIARLRHKLGSYADHIHNRQGYGYCFE